MRTLNLIEKKFENFIIKNSKYIVNKKIGIGVSGGPDSLSLAILLNKYRRKYNLDLFAFTVDHQLRIESQKEAQFVKSCMDKLSICHKTIVWKKPHSQHNILETARIARYNLIAKECIKNDIDLIMIGHHANDQIETFIIRLEANSGLDGLACMKSNTTIITDFTKLNIIRPLLNFEKKDLKEVCRKTNINWVSDPTNYNLKYKRTKARYIAKNKSLSHDFKLVINQYSKLKLNIDKLLNNQIKKNVKFNDNGICEIKNEFIEKLPKLFQKKILILLIKIIGGKKYPRKSLIINRIITNIHDVNINYFTAGGVYFIKSKNIILLIRQNEPSINQIILQYKTTIWDRRFLITKQCHTSNISVGPLTEKDYINMVKLKKIQKTKMPFAAIKTLPTFRVLDEIVSIPHLLYYKNYLWKKNIKIEHIENDLFISCNKLYI